MVTAATRDAGSITMFSLADGSQVTLDGAKYTYINGGGNASVGDLLLTDQAATWMSSLRINRNADAPPGCFDLLEGGIDDGGYIKFEGGLRLPKAADFDPGAAQNGVYQIPLVGFCVDSSGAVTKYRS